MTDLQIFTADRWIGEADDIDAARAAARQLHEDGEDLPIRVERDGRLVASYDGETFRVHQVIA